MPTQKNHSKFSSRVLRINIELPNYKFFHSPSLMDQNDDRFIGRMNIIERLKNILTKNEPKSGAYLISGYRGMGKSSFVNKVLNQITLKKGVAFSRFLRYCIVFFIIYLVASFYNLRIDPFLTPKVFSLIATLLVFILDCWLFSPKIVHLTKNLLKVKMMQLRQKEWKELLKFQKSGFSWKYYFSNLKAHLIERINTRRRIVLKLNLGHEILNEKDILSLIAKNIEKEFRQFAYSFRRQNVFYILKATILIALTIQILKTEPIPEKFYDTIFPTQKKEFKDEMKFDKEKYTRLIQQIKLDNLTNESVQKDSTKFAVNSIPKQVKFILYRGINLADIYCDGVYCYLSNEVKNILSIKTNKFPTHLNYLFLFIFIILNFSLSFFFEVILRSNYTRFTSRRSIIRKLRQLNDHIDAAVKTELSSGLGTNESKLGININQRKAKEYPIAGIRQMENSIIEIFDEMNNLLFLILQPEFIVVFDELDKIDPRSNTNISDKEEELTDFDISTSGFTGGTATRFRKQNVLKLLANLKYFITTAKAKFIFISGRELYDAYLADVSDREFSISSIFHDVIYVESFLSDTSDRSKSDIICMTEHYVCQLLIPEWFVIYMTRKKSSRHAALTLKCYEDYLCEVLKFNKQENEVKKTMMLLYQFIHYLTHVSNGAPKKITNLFERHIVSANCCNKGSDFYVGNLNKDFFLSFSYLDQCKIGFIHYLANPIILAIVNNVSNYGDKLLVSTSFLIDHIYKFHGNGFSWRNLEHAPEILDINRTPELRSFISTIIGYLSQTHISPVVSGLYIFKFPKKISEEISLISKMSEEASAIYNFTLDESLSIKRHYSKLLQHYTRQFNFEKQNDFKDGEFFHSIADIHYILGDLHLFDEEYTEAIFEYQSCIQHISRDWSEIHDSHQVTHMLFIVRTMLKLGLVFEKRKTFNSAYLAYCDLVSMAIDLRHIDENKLGLEYKTEKEEGWAKQKAVLFKSNPSHFDDEDVFRREMKPESMKEGEKGDIIFSVTGDELIPSLARITTPFKNKLITRLSLFEDIRLMYQASLAKLFVLEKNQLGGISLANLDVIEGEFRNLHLATNLKEKFLISSDFFKKLGDIMYYKNGLINNESSNLFIGLDFWGYDVNNDIDYVSKNSSQSERLKYITKITFKNFKCRHPKIPFQSDFNRSLKEYLECDNNFVVQTKIDDKYLGNKLKDTKIEIVKFFRSESCCMKGMDSKILDKVMKCNDRRAELLNNRNITPCYACKYYNRSLKILADNLLKQEENDSAKSKALIFLKALDEPGKFYSNRSNFSQLLASTLGGFGDILVSCSLKSEKIDETFLIAFFRYIISEKKDRFENFKFDIQSIELSHLEKAMLYFLVSAKYHKRSSNLKEAHVMYKKILLLFIQFVSNDPMNRDYIGKYLPDIKNQIVRRIIQCIYSAYEHIHVVEIQKIKWMNTQELYELLELSQLSLFPDLEETLYAFFELQIICNRTKKNESIDSNIDISMERLYRMQSLSPFRLNSSIYNRLISLRFKALLNRKLFEELFTGYSFEVDVYKPNHAILFYNKLLESLNRSESMDSFLITSFKLKGEDNKTALLKAMEHLVIDSIFCLQKFIETVYPHNKTTLFTNSYIANIYKQLLEWSQLFDFLFMLYAYMDDNYPSEQNHQNEISRKNKDITDTLVGHCLHRYEVTNKFTDVEREQNKTLLEYIFSFQTYPNPNTFDDLTNIEELKNQQQLSFLSESNLFQGRAKNLFNELCTSIDKSNTHLINSNYLAEMGIKKYQNAFSMHKEGKPYKSMIEDMYYLNDDLDNDSFKFYLALERYRINSGIVIENMSKLKNLYSNSKLFDVGNYLGTTN